MPNSRVSRSNVSRVKKEKKPTAIQIGDQNEARTQVYYESLGYVVDTTRRAKFKQNDYFGLFDHICISATSVRLVQTKTNQLPSRIQRQKIKDFVVPPEVFKEIVLWKDGQDNPIIYKY